MYYDTKQSYIFVCLYIRHNDIKYKFRLALIYLCIQIVNNWKLKRMKVFKKCFRTSVFELLSRNIHLCVATRQCWILHPNFDRAFLSLIYRSFTTRVSQLKIWHFLVIGIGKNICRCTFNRYSVIVCKTRRWRAGVSSLHS